MRIPAILKSKIFRNILFLAVIAFGFNATKSNITNDASAQGSSPSSGQVKAEQNSCDGNLAIGMVLDRSSSMNAREPDDRTKLDWAKEAANTFVNEAQNTGFNNIAISVSSFGAQGNDGTGTKTADYNSTLHIGLSSNYTSIRSAINAIRFIRSGTCIQCGIRIANSQVVNSQAKRVVMVLSDGKENHNWEGNSVSGSAQLSVAEANAGRSRGIEYWVIGYGQGTGVDHNVLRAIAGADERYLYRPNASEWESAVLEILDEICYSTTITVPDVTLNGIGASQDIFAVVNPPGFITGPMSFNAEDAIASFNPPIKTPAYVTRVIGLREGVSTYYARAKDIYGNDVVGSARIRVLNQVPWCQGIGGDIISLNNVRCQIPATCVSPGCTPAISVSAQGFSPGVVFAEGSIDDGAGKTSPPQDPYMSVTGGRLAGHNISYDFLLGRVPTNLTQINDLSTSSILSVPIVQGYRWVKSSCPATIPESGLNLGTNKVILFADCFVNINGKVNLTKGRGFFMVIASGDIIVSPEVKDLRTFESPPDNVPELNGIYFSEGDFTTGTKGMGLDQQLHVRGSAIAKNFVLERILPDNSLFPAELFEFAPDQVFLQPPQFMIRKINWREVAP